MELERITNLLSFFSEEKYFFDNGYYRIRIISDLEKELAFLVLDGCGSTSVHPQITIEKFTDKWLATKLIDLKTRPTKMIYRNEATSEELDEALNDLVNKFEKVMNNK